MNKRRPRQITFRVSDEEYDLLQRKIVESGKNQQEYILSCVLDRPIVNTDGVKPILTELKRQGANLNQLTKKLNERGYIDYRHDLPNTLEGLRETWQSLRQSLQRLQSKG